MGRLKRLLVCGETQQLSPRSEPFSLSSSLGAACRFASPFRRRRSEEKKAAEDDKSSLSAPAIDPSDISAVATSYTSAGAMDDIERRMWLMLIKDIEIFGGEAGRRVVGREATVSEVVSIVEKGLSAAGLMMEDVVLPPAAIALDVLKERI
ncbi:uncharacterized protein MONOS_15203 [Monocercomonoides exilis]|uniref:uncharacterized protein n=1 Tax=Monocercomonoides exilis TaxID=2049356 RepID=UPI0035596F48|nr:hypothetical protein MONOS_15203 [Monocercomonoides exilis]|eukprot:MONOS_15203.1-p1 / transcript=MONOS_15203.1 / gene=MONOS_15203 / organism=Monocercomonoides_exilis_PA203 / gene_product=unspecified product / transcript_product=unspecified product / location=Mono_scaffold01169:7907-8619(-) / protein_length=151 / sequence_SO=supercontig / SO=protein_coding / is_pseudo=false